MGSVKMIENVCYVIGREEEVLHFLVLCDEFEWERQKLYIEEDRRH